jgi:hypothetical protein
MEFCANENTVRVIKKRVMDSLFIVLELESKEIIIQSILEGGLR